MAELQCNLLKWEDQLKAKLRRASKNAANSVRTKLSFFPTDTSQSEANSGCTKQLPPPLLLHRIVTKACEL